MEFEENRYNHTIHVLLGSKIRVLSLSIHQFPYSKGLIHSKRQLKRILCTEFKDIPLNHLSLRESLPKPKTGEPNLDIL